MNTLKKLLKIVFLFILTTYGCMILSAINLWLFQYINNFYQHSDYYYGLFTVSTACATVVVTMYLSYKKKN